MGSTLDSDLPPSSIQVFWICHANMESLRDGNMDMSLWKRQTAYTYHPIMPRWDLLGLTRSRSDLLVRLTLILFFSVVELNSQVPAESRRTQLPPVNNKIIPDELEVSLTSTVCNRTTLGQTAHHQRCKVHSDQEGFICIAQFSLHQCS